MTRELTKVNLKFPMFWDQCQPTGFLTRDKRCHALWYYMALATKCKATVGDGPSSQILIVPSHDEGSQLWMDKHYEQIARTVALIYGLDSPSDYWGFWPWVEDEAIRCGITIPDEVRHFAPGKIIIT